MMSQEDQVVKTRHAHRIRRGKYQHGPSPLQQQRTRAMRHFLVVHRQASVNLTLHRKLHQGKACRMTEAMKRWRSPRNLKVG